MKCDANKTRPAPTNTAAVTNVTLGSRHVSTPKICSQTVATLSIVVWMFAINAVSSSYCFIRDAKGFMLPAILGASAAPSSSSESCKTNTTSSN